MKNIKSRQIVNLCMLFLLTFAVMFICLGGSFAVKANAQEANEQITTSELQDMTMAAAVHPEAEPPFLDIRIVRQQGGFIGLHTWVIQVTNNNDFAVTVEYNSKMCNLDEASKWASALKDVESVYLAAHSSTHDEYVNSSGQTVPSTHLQIMENWFAKYITVSFKHPQNNQRYISYACELNENGTMSVSYAQVVA